MDDLVSLKLCFSLDGVMPAFLSRPAPSILARSKSENSIIYTIDAFAGFLKCMSHSISHFFSCRFLFCGSCFGISHFRFYIFHWDVPICILIFTYCFGGGFWNCLCFCLQPRSGVVAHHPLFHVSSHCQKISLTLNLIF